MDLEETINRLLSNPGEKADPEWVKEVMQEHPTFATAGALLLRSNPEALSPNDKKRLQAQVMLAAADPTAMGDLADIAQSDWQHFYPTVEESREKTTSDTIDTFLNTYGHSSAEEDALLERMIFNPVAPDYFSGTDLPYDPKDPLVLPPELQQGYNTEPQVEVVVEAVPETTTGPVAEPESALANPMLHKHTLGENETPQTTEEPLLMESLAKIFIKQRRYERAFEIIKTISLKNPEKSAYFADQLRFLQKLINNQRYLQSKKQV